MLTRMISATISRRGVPSTCNPSFGFFPLQVMRAWKGAAQLCRLLQAVEPDFLKMKNQAGRRPEGPYAEVLPFMISQQQDWEAYSIAGQSSTLSQARICCLHLKSPRHEASSQGYELLFQFRYQYMAMSK